MAVDSIDFEFTTGPASLPDVGTLSYNGCTFSPLFETQVSGSAIEDEANRTVKYMEYTILADGYVTMPDQDSSIDPRMSDLRTLLYQQGGTLVYQGRGMDLTVNPAGGGGGGNSSKVDVAWGPVPRLLEFQPLGHGRSAKVRWECKTRIPEVTAYSISTYTRGGLASIPLLQFNYETSVSYGDDGFSTLSVRGVMEIPMTRSPSITSRILTKTVDDVRSQIDSRVMSGIDLTRFQVSRRDFHISRDKRTMMWEFIIEEKPYMDLPEDCTVAHGTYSVRPARTGPGLVMWLCTLRASYTVRGDSPRRLAWLAFLALLRLRMSSSKLSPDLVINNPGTKPRGPGLFRILSTAGVGPIIDILRNYRAKLQRDNAIVNNARKALLLDLSFDEGLYKDSKTTSFSATWRLVCPISHILVASGLWTKVEGNDRTLWSTSVSDISGSKSWLRNRIDPKLDVIVDIGGG